MNETKPSKPQRIFGYVLVIGAIVVLVTAVTQFFMDMRRINEQARIVHITKVAPVKQAWRLDLDSALKDPRTLQSWDYLDAQASVSSMDGTGSAGMLTQNQQMVLVKGTDGTKEIQLLALVNLDSGTAQWQKTYADLPLDYCLEQMWQGGVVCESDQAQKIVRIHPDGNIEVGALPEGMWGLATGQHVLAAVFDKFLVVPLAVSAGGGAGTEVDFITSNYTIASQFKVLTPNATAAQPQNTQTRNSITLSGALTSASDGSNRQSTWGFSQGLASSTGTLDTSGLGAESQASMLEAGFFASAEPTEKDQVQVKWAIYNPDGSVASTGSAPTVAAQALHAQLRAGLMLDASNAATALNSGKIPALTGNRDFWLTPVSDSCAQWSNCESRDWTSPKGASVTLKKPARVLYSTEDTMIFVTTDGALMAYGAADGKSLWEGVLPLEKAATSKGDPLAFAGGVAQLSQLGQIDAGDAKAVLTYWTLP